MTQTNSCYDKDNLLSGSWDHGQRHGGNLLKAGYKLTVWNRNAEKCEPFARKGAHVADTPADAVRDVDLVMYSLSDDQAVEDIVFGAKGILSGIKEGQIAMDMSTVLPATSLREQELTQRGVSIFSMRLSLAANKNPPTPSFGLWPRAIKPF